MAAPEELAPLPDTLLLGSDGALSVLAIEIVVGQKSGSEGALVQRLCAIKDSAAPAKLVSSSNEWKQGTRTRMKAR